MQHIRLLKSAIGEEVTLLVLEFCDVKSTKTFASNSTFTVCNFSLLHSKDHPTLSTDSRPSQPNLPTDGDDFLFGLSLWVCVLPLFAYAI